MADPAAGGSLHIAKRKRVCRGGQHADGAGGKAFVEHLVKARGGHGAVQQFRDLIQQFQNGAVDLQRFLGQIVSPLCSQPFCLLFQLFPQRGGEHMAVQRAAKILGRFRLFQRLRQRLQRRQQLFSGLFGSV